MFQDKAQSAENGMSFTRTVTRYWIIWVAPFGRAVKRSSAVLRLLPRTRHYRRGAPGGQPLHDSLSLSIQPCWTTRTLCKKSRGFTLVEVMVALVIAALGLAAVAASVSQMVDAGYAMRQRTYASWIAQNKIAELRLANVLPDVSETSGETDYVGREWSWQATISETGVDNLYRVDVQVGLRDGDENIRTVTGFIGEPGVPGQSNLVWVRNSLAVGEAE